METLAWALSGLLILAGFIGSVLPGIPGTPLILLGAVIHRWMIPGGLSWWTIAGLAVLMIVGHGLGILSAGVAASRGGASKLTMVAVVIGGVAGLFVGFFWFLALPLLLAVGVEWLICQKRLPEATRIGAQVGVGMLVGGILQFLVALLMVLWIVADLVYF